MKRVYLGLGSNLGDRVGWLQKAVDELDGRDLQVLRSSGVWETAAVGDIPQPDFLNIVLEADTTLFPMSLLRRIQRIENELGRKRLKQKGPRNIDIDILLHGRFSIATNELQVPHPRMMERRFVLEPLAELVPEMRHPGLRKTVRELLGSAPRQLVRRTAFTIELLRQRTEHRP